MLIYYYRSSLMLCALVFAALGLLYLLKPSLTRKLNSALQSRRVLFPTLVGTAMALYGFILYFGNRQFGAYDFSALIDTGWRLATGQRAYVDFPTALPPGFMLGIKYAFLAWGVYWDAQLQAAALFSCITFLWSYWLLTRILRTELAALLTAVCLQSVSMLVCAYWWYNPIASVSGGIFLLSSVLYLVRPQHWAHQGSLVISLFLLSLMKPNTAAPLIAGALLLLLASGARLRYKTLSLIALSFVSAAAFLFVNEMPVNEVLSSYRTVARSRGLTKFEGLKNGVPIGNLVMSVLFVGALLVPFRLLRHRLRGFRLQRDFTAIRLTFLLCLGPTVGVMAMLTNGEYKFIDMVLLVIPGVIMMFGRPEFELVGAGIHQANRVYYAALICALTAVAILTGATRARVFSIGPFVELGSSLPAGHPFFPNLRTGPKFVKLLQNVKSVLASQPKTPIFFGPRMEFAYAAFGLPSPAGLPIWWHPGTSFAIGRQEALLLEWEKRRFGTLIFVKNDYTYYGPELVKLLGTKYVKDESYPAVTVLRLKQ